VHRAHTRRDCHNDPEKSVTINLENETHRIGVSYKKIALRITNLQKKKSKILPARADIASTRAK
jgi:predicted transcriptional regulator